MTDYTAYVIVIAEYGSGPQRALDVRPQGEHLLWDPGPHRLTGECRSLVLYDREISEQTFEDIRP